MRDILITIPSPTSKKIAIEMGNISRYRRRAETLEFANNLIRWGNTKTVAVEGIELNRRDAVILASDKPACRALLRKHKLPVPTESEKDFPVIGRRQKHMAGRGFYFCENEREVQRAKENGAVYFSKFYPKKNEYRVHVAGGRVLLMSIKEGDKDEIIWNKAISGFTFKHLRRKVWLNDDNLREMCRTAKRAIKLLGLDFGAVDIMADAGRGYKPFVISEINTAPNLSPLAISKYVRYFREALEEDEEFEEDEEHEEDEEYEE